MTNQNRLGAYAVKVSRAVDGRNTYKVVNSEAAQTVAKDLETLEEARALMADLHNGRKAYHHPLGRVVNVPLADQVAETCRRVYGGSVERNGLAEAMSYALLDLDLALGEIRRALQKGNTERAEEYLERARGWRKGLGNVALQAERKEAGK